MRPASFNVTLRPTLSNNANPKSSSNRRIERLNVGCGIRNTSADVFDFTLTDEDMAVFATLDDPAFKPIFDHLDVDTVSGLLNVFVGKQLNGEKFY